MSKIKKENPAVVLAGRVNVGKSTLFNKLTETRQAIVSDIAGTTRDRQYGQVLWRGENFTIIDAAGLDVKDPDLIEEQSLKQADIAIAQADLVLFVVDAKSGPLADDKKILKRIRLKNKKDILLVVNKCDSARQDATLPEFYKLGLGDPIPVSALSGRGSGDLLDIIFEKINLNKQTAEIVKEKVDKKIKVALIGKPNVGKSSLFNVIAGEERVIVNEKPHTTRDRQTIDVDYKAKNGSTYNFQFIDTAGVRKKGKVKGKLERQGIEQSLQSIEESDVALLITDCSRRLEFQDKNLAQQIMENHPSLIIVANKWDLIPEKDTKTQKKYIEYYQTMLPFLAWAPIVFVSAKSGFRVSKLMEMLVELIEARKQVISQSGLDRLLKSLIKKQPPRAKSRLAKPPYIYEINQIGIDPPTFAVIVNEPKWLSFSYRRYLLNSLREKFFKSGSGIKLIAKKRQQTL
ncbi:MAG: ribosome biogenesis GTPase Der [Patescibacteria group bacterium]